MPQASWPLSAQAQACHLLRTRAGCQVYISRSGAAHEGGVIPGGAARAPISATPVVRKYRNPGDSATATPAAPRRDARNSRDAGMLGYLRGKERQRAVHNAPTKTPGSHGVGLFHVYLGPDIMGDAAHDSRAHDCYILFKLELWQVSVHLQVLPSL